MRERITFLACVCVVLSTTNDKRTKDYPNFATKKIFFLVVEVRIGLAWAFYLVCPEYEVRKHYNSCKGGPIPYKSLYI